MTDLILAFDFGGTKHTAGLIERGAREWLAQKQVTSPPGADGDRVGGPSERQRAAEAMGEGPRRPLPRGQRVKHGEIVHMHQRDAVVP